MKEKFIVSIVATLGNYITTLFAFYLLFLKLDKELISTYNFVNSVIALGFLFTDLGIKMIHYRFSTKENYSLYFSSYFMIKIILIVVNTIISLILITILQLWGSGYIIYLLMFLFLMILLSMMRLLITNLRSRKKILICEFLHSGYTISKNILIVFLVFNLTSFSEPLAFLYFTDFILSLIFLGLFVYFSKKELVKLTTPKKELMYLYLKETKFIMLRAVLFTIINNIGNIILFYSFGHDSLANFSLVHQILLIFMGISTSLIPLYLSIYSEYFKEKRISLIEQITYKVEKYSSIIFLAIILIIFSNGELMLSIFLPKYLDTLPILLIMAFMPYFLGITRPYENQLISGEKQNAFAFSGIFIYLLQLILIILLVPKQVLFFTTLGLGSVGYALALTIPWGLYAIMCRYFSKIFFNIKSQKLIFKHALFASLAFVVFLPVKIFVLKPLISNQILLLFSSTLIILCIFLGELLLFNQLKKDDLIFFLDLLHLKRYKKALKEELTG